MRTRILGGGVLAATLWVSTVGAGTLPVDGDWIGGFEGDEGTVFVTAHFQTNETRVGGTIDMPLAGERGIPLEQVAADDRRVTFEVPNRFGNLRFEGKRRTETTIAGSVRQALASRKFELFKITRPSPTVISEVVGNYELPDRVLLISQGPSGLLLLDERAGRLGTLFALSDDEYVAGPSFAAGYPIEARLRIERDRTGQVSSLMWQQGKDAPQRAMRRTFYTSELVGFRNEGVWLSGTLLKPIGSGPHPAIVMIHGSGPATRDGLRPYADLFARNGIAVLIHDKRGTGSSSGNWTRATFDELAGDALAGVRFLQKRADINPRQIGVQGVSLGGWIAPLAAARSSDVAFVIVESAPAVTPARHERLRVEHQLRADGFEHEAIAHALAYMDRKFDVARTGEGWDGLQDALARGAREGWDSYVNPPSSLESLQWNWTHVLSYDPQPVLARVTCPVLVLYGALDSTVPVNENHKRMADALAHNGDITIKVFEKANHAFFQAVTGGRQESGRLKSLVPGYLTTRVDWVRQRVSVRSAVSIADVSKPTTATYR